MSLVPKTVVPRWFVKRRGMAMGVLSCGWQASQAVMPAVNARVIAHSGWRAAWFLWAVTLLAFIPVSWALMVDDPADMGLVPDGDPQPSGDVASPGATAAAPGKGEPAGDGHPAAGGGDLDTAATIGTRAFAVLSLCNICHYAVHTAVTFYAFAIAPGGAPAFLAARSVASLPVNLTAGWLVDKACPQRVMAMGFGVEVAGLYLLLCGGEGTIQIAGGLLGAASALVAISMGVAIPACFGTQHLGTINGLFSAVGVVGSAAGPFIYGSMYDRTGSFEAPLWGSLVFAVACVALSFGANGPRREQAQK